MAQVITLTGERLFALKAQNNQQLDIDTFIFAYVPGQDSTAPIDRNEGLPPVNQRVHTQIVQQYGMINENAVVYSSVLDSLTGPFQFNWVGLYSAVNQTLIAIQHIPTVSKTVTEPGASGNILNRNFVIEYSGIAELTGITVDPATWQLDYTARLNGMDELTRQLAADMNGKDWFIDDGFKVVPRSTLNTFKVTAGAGYVSGLRVELAADHILTLSSYPQFVYVDAWFDGTSESVWKGHTAFTVTNTEMDDYIDVNGRNHYVFKLARITAADAVEDLRSIGAVDYRGFKEAALSAARLPFESDSEKEGDSKILKAIRKINNDRLYPLKQYFENEYNVVITGDSLSYNAFDFPTATPLKATFQVPGLMSWSFMLKDLAKRQDKGFKYLDSCPYEIVTGTAVIEKNNLEKYYLPLNSRCLGLTATSDNTEVNVLIGHEGIKNKIVVHIAETPTIGEVTLQIGVYPYGPTDFTEEVIVSLNNAPLGGGYFISQVPVNVLSTDKPYKIKLKNFKNKLGVSDGSRTLLLSCVTSRKSNIITSGIGGWTSADVIDDYDDMIGQYHPDLLMLMIGANDRGQGVTKEQYAKNIEMIIDRVRSDNQYCDIVILTTTPASNAEFQPNVIVNGSTIEDFNESARLVAVNKNCYFLDVFDLFIVQNPGIWRFDNIHMSRSGNYILFNSIVNEFIGQVKEEHTYDHELQFVSGENNRIDWAVKNGFFKVMFSQVDDKYLYVSSVDDSAVIKSVEKINSFTIEINLNYEIGKHLNIPKLEMYGEFGVGGHITATVAEIINNKSVRYYLVSNGAVIDDTINNNQKYLISF